MHRFRIRLIFALIVSITVVSVGFTYLDVLAHRHVLRQELDRRAQWMGRSILPAVEQALGTGDTAKILAMTELEKKTTDSLALAVFDYRGTMLASGGEPQVLQSADLAPMRKTLQKNSETTQYGHHAQWQWVEKVFPIYTDNHLSGAVTLFVDAGYIRTETNGIWRRSLLRIASSVILIAGITTLMVSWFVTRPLSRITERMRRLRSGHARSGEPEPADLNLFSPIAREVETIAASLKAARAAAKAEAHLREAGESWWTAEKLTLNMRGWTGPGRIFVVSNREPYMHTRRGNAVDCVVPASGLVTALEPVLRACDGTWIAHGSGDADAFTVDESDRLRVPPDDPKYTLRRVWLTAEEEAQYYDGFANEGLWPLCHIAHTRPIFRMGDWECYQRINERFARVLLEEMEGISDPIVFVQDYHFALLPRLVKRARPDARVAIFWHIPWPNPEAFGICPWQNELLDGLLGADLIGFHIPLHCHNFMATVDRALEARTSADQMTVRRHGHQTTVRPYPISVAVESSLRAFAEPIDPLLSEEHRAVERNRLLQPFGVQAECMAIGVDRLDYTKGIEERLMALEHFFEQYPWFQERIVLVQIAAPSRSRVASYANLRHRVHEMANRINARFQTARWKPILLIERQCGHDEVRRWYSAADLCLVTSLHDGMNLVAKEFVAARDDEDGVLVLSRFAGASGELHDALIVNPYDISGVADAIHRGLEMDPRERQERMRRMRRYVMEHNIYLWASAILGDLRDLRIEGEEKEFFTNTPFPAMRVSASGGISLGTGRRA
jgi:trehalose 6-phosphate synthase